MVICLERGADLHITQLMPLPFTVSCFAKIQIGFTFLVLTYPGSPAKGPLNRCCCCCRCRCCVACRFGREERQAAAAGRGAGKSSSAADDCSGEDQEGRGDGEEAVAS